MAQDKIIGAVKNSLNQLVFNYLKYVFLAFLGIYLLSGIYKIDKDSAGVVTRCGALRYPQVSPGLHYKLPWPIDKVSRVAVKQMKTVEISDFFMKDGKPVSKLRGDFFFFDTNIDPYCITGDNNIVAVKLLLKYTISDPVAFLFKNKNSDFLMERVAASIVVHMLAQRKIDEILTFGKKQIELEMLKKLKQEMEMLKTGISLSFLEIANISPPKKLEHAFNQVINAKVNKNKMLNEAQGYYNRVVPQARSSADKIIQDATAFKQERILTAAGQASRFLSRLEGFRQDPVITKNKIYFNFIKSLYPRLGEIRIVHPSYTKSSFPFGLSKTVPD